MNGECPREIDGAIVIAYAENIWPSRHTGNTQHNVAGQVQDAAKAVIIAQYEGDESYYVFSCYEENWVTNTDTWHQNLESAINQINFEYRGLSEHLVWYVSKNT